MDFVLVIQGIHSVMSSMPSSRRLTEKVEGSTNVSFTRSLRIFKVSKVFRIFRGLKYLREMRIMFVSLVSSGSTVFWAFMMLSFILAISALVIGSFLASYLTLLRNEVAAGELTQEEWQAVATETRRWFGTVWRSVQTLYKCANGGLDWHQIHVVVMVDAYADFAFCAFVFFFQFSVLSILSGIFIEKALRNAEPDRRGQAIEQRKLDRLDAEALRALLTDIVDEDGDGMISMQEFEVALDEDSVRGLMAALGIEVADASQVFTILAADLQEDLMDSIPIDEFCSACMGLKGTATTLDVAAVGAGLSTMKREMHELSMLVGRLTKEP